MTITDILSNQSPTDNQRACAAEELLSLGDLIRDVARHADDDATPIQIAADVIDKFGEDVRGRLLLQLVADAVRNVLGGERRAALSHGVHGNSSRKLARRRDWWARVLTTRVPSADGSWKLLGQCDIDDLRHCIADREQLIARTRLQIENYERLIEAMIAHGAVVVSDLTAEQVSL